MAVFDRSDTSEKVIDIVAQKLSVEKSSVTQDATFQDLGADSLSTFEILLKFQDTFGIEIDDEAADNFSSLRDAIDYMHERRTK